MIIVPIVIFIWGVRIVILIHSTVIKTTVIKIAKRFNFLFLKRTFDFHLFI